MAKDHTVCLKCHPLLFPRFQWFNIKAALAHYSVNQNEVDELLAKGAIEPCIGGAYFLFLSLCGT